MAKKNVVKADYPHFEEKRLVKIWTKKAGKSFQMSVEGIGGRFYGSLTRKMDGGVIADQIGEEKIAKRAGGELKNAIKSMDKKAKLALLLQLLA